MYHKIPYTDAELKLMDPIPDYPNLKLKNQPITPRENFKSIFFDKKPYYFPTFEYCNMREPYNMHMGRIATFDIIDDFGIKWKYEPIAGGSIVDPDSEPILDDVNNWKEKIILPDINTWDWEGAAKAQPHDTRFLGYVTLSNGFWFERLISFMGFTGAAMALIDEDQQDAIHELFGAMTDIGCEVIKKYCEVFPSLDVICVPDDWGSQLAPFFSEDIAREFFLPYMKKITDCIHSCGRIASLHSCGHNEVRTHIFVEAGFDEWSPQTMNDIEKMYDEYGDKIVLGVFPTRTDIPDLPEEGQRQAAREFVDRFSQPGKPAFLSMANIKYCTPAFLEEVYVYSRKKYVEMY